MKKKVKYSIEGSLVGLIVLGIVFLLVVRAFWRTFSMNDGWEAEF